MQTEIPEKSGLPAHSPTQGKTRRKLKAASPLGLFHTTGQFSQQLCLADGFVPLLHEKCSVITGKSPQARSFQKDETQGTLLAWHRNTTPGCCLSQHKPECSGRALAPAHQSCCGSDITATALPGRRVFFCWGKQLPSSLPLTAQQT